MKERIQIADAKNELLRINEVLNESHLLIGGLAVNQYNQVRLSIDIDLVIRFEDAMSIVSMLYPTLYWDIIDNNHDEFRPSYKIVNRKNKNLIIEFGPKIIQRKPYEFIDWNILKQNAKKFEYKNTTLDNILIPSVVDLSFIKLISFISRKINKSKSNADLSDFANLTNHAEWNPIDFYSLINKMEANDFLYSNLNFEIYHYEILKKSSFFQLLILFSKQDSLNNLIEAV